MPCRKVAEFNGRAGKQRLVGQTPSGPVYAPFRTEAECNQACQEGACCEGTVCSVKPQCQCQGAGKVFQGVGTVCTPNPCLCVRYQCCRTDLPQTRTQNVRGTTYYCYQCDQYPAGTTAEAANSMCSGTLKCGICSDEGICNNCGFTNPLP
jgi:hypothetical protein